VLVTARNPLSIVLLGVAIAAMFVTAFSAVGRGPRQTLTEPKGESR
jgi:hypothetical protein